MSHISKWDFFSLILLDKSDKRLNKGSVESLDSNNKMEDSMASQGTQGKVSLDLADLSMMSKEIPAKEVVQVVHVSEWYHILCAGSQT